MRPGPEKRGQDAALAEALHQAGIYEELLRQHPDSPMAAQRQARIVELRLRAAAIETSNSTNQDHTDGKEV
jgi:hypothetical protein